MKWRVELDVHEPLRQEIVEGQRQRGLADEVVRTDRVVIEDLEEGKSGKFWRDQARSGEASSRDLQRELRHEFELRRVHLHRVPVGVCADMGPTRVCSSGWAGVRAASRILSVSMIVLLFTTRCSVGGEALSCAGCLVHST